MGYDAYVNFGVKVPVGMAEVIRVDLAENLYKDNCDDFDLETDVSKVYGRMRLFSESSDEVAAALQVFADKYQITFAVDYDDEQEDTLRFYVGQDRRLEELKDQWAILTRAMTQLLKDEVIAIQAYHAVMEDPGEYNLTAEEVALVLEFGNQT